MQKKFYINKKNHSKTLKTYALIGVSSAVLCVLLFYLGDFLGHIEIPHLLGGAVMISFFAFYRTLFLLKLPLIKVDNDTVAYFNIFWYKKYCWEDLHIAVYDAEDAILTIKNSNGRIFNHLHLSSLTAIQMDEILLLFTNKRIKIVNSSTQRG